MSNLTILEAAKKVAQEVATKNPSLNNSACMMALPTLSYPTGKKTLSESETMVDGVKIEGEALNKVDLDWFPQKRLAPFNTLRKAAKSLMAKSSVEVGGLYIVSVECLPNLMEQLIAYQNKWDKAFIDLVQNYEIWLEEHLKSDKNKNLTDVIKKCAMTVGEFSSGFRFAINPAMKVETLFSEQTTSFAGEVALSLWDEVAKMAEDIHKSLFLNAKEKLLSQKGITSIKKLRNKLVNLSFVHDGVDLIVARFDEVMSTMPKTGPVENLDYYKAAHMVLQFSSAARLKAEADGLDGLEEYEDPLAVTDVDSLQEDSTATQSSQVTSDVSDDDLVLPDNVVSIECQLEDQVEDPGKAQQAELDWASF